ncbi:translin [Skeletonema marinoi]|uniref:Translin n=1 Tax=Skeletonema marinoi TaxID=267567 RepID=A0AAD9D6P6_9STRA|nr:translin [Skeletonema marinoi]
MRPTALCASLLTAATRSLALTTSTTAYTRLVSSSTKMVDYRELTNQLVTKMKQEDDLRNKAYDRSWELNAALIRVEMAHEEVLSSPDKKELISTLEKEEETLDELFRETALSPAYYNNIVHNPSGDDEITTIHERAPRRGNIDYKMESYARYKAVRHYLQTENDGLLLSPNAPCFSGARNILTDEEYLGGACIGLCHDLSKIAVSRASNAMSDPTAVQFVQDARDTVSNILQELLEFDWRNSPLRRKYDSTKYALKQLETVMYELSVAGALGGHSLKSEEEGGPKKKRIKVDDENNSDEKDEGKDAEMKTSALDTFKQEIAEVKERMDHRDKLRETLIKTSRDSQKAAKNSIFAMHRGNTKSAVQLLLDCENCVRNDLLPIVKEEPTLRGGSFSNVLEEYVEGKLFYCWLHGNGGEESGDSNDNNNDKPAGKILTFDEITLPITVDEYIGGLCDLTGEIGRFAVARGTVRDKESVKICLETSKNIYMAIRMAGKLPGNINKKMNPLKNSIEKMERILYEQSLMEMAGRKFQSSMEEGGFDAED